MANFAINIAKQVYEEVFGNFALPKALNLEQRVEKRQTDGGTDLYKKDEFGRDMFCPVTLKVDGKEYTLPYSTVTVSVSKKIVNTELPNRRGSVNEVINLNDLKFQVNGVVVSKTDKLPEDWIKKFAFLAKTKKPIEIINPITDMYMEDEQRVVILSHNLPNMRGISYAQAYSFKLKSDTNLELDVAIKADLPAVTIQG